MELRRASSVDEVASDTLVTCGGTELVPLLRAGLVTGDIARSTCAGSCRAASSGGTIGAGATLAELECDPQVPDVLREACRLAASPQLRNMGTLAGNLLQSTRCWYWRLDWPCRLHGGDECFAHKGEHGEHAIFANGFCASAHPSDVAAALLALDATRPHQPRASCRSPRSTGCRPRTTGATTTLEPGELILSVDVRRLRRVRLPEGDGAQALGVPARRRRCGAARRRDTRRARRRRADAVAARRKPRRGDAAAAERVQGRDREGAREARAKQRSQRVEDRRSRSSLLARRRARRLRRRRSRLVDTTAADDDDPAAAIRSTRRRPRSGTSHEADASRSTRRRRTT